MTGTSDDLIQRQYDATDKVEKALLGSLLIDRDAIASVADRITPDAFLNQDNATVFRAVMRCWEKRIPPDLITVWDELEHDTGHELQLTDLTEMMADPWILGCHVQYYAERVVARARQRAVQGAAARMAELSMKGDVDPAVFLAETQEQLGRFGAVVEKQGPRSYADLMPDFQDQLMRIRSGELKHSRTASGFPGLDYKLSGGFAKGDLIILAARPGMGKSAMALNLAHRVGRQGRHTIVFSAEMTAESLLRRAVAEIAGVPSSVVFSDTFTDEQFDRFLSASDVLTELPVSIDDTSGISTAQMLVRVQAEQRLHDVGLVIFDYIELAGDQLGKNDNEERRINAITKKLKHLAMTCGVPVMALAQLNRQVESRTSKRPMLSDLRHSGSIEQDADKVIFLYRPAYYANQMGETVNPGEEHLCEVIVSKNRNGANGTVNMYFKEETMSFHEMSVVREARA